MHAGNRKNLNVPRYNTEYSSCSISFSLYISCYIQEIWITFYQTVCKYNLFVIYINFEVLFKTYIFIIYRVQYCRLRKNWRELYEYLDIPALFCVYTYCRLIYFQMHIFCVLLPAKPLSLSVSIGIWYFKVDALKKSCFKIFN